MAVRVDTVEWAEALGCSSSEDLAARLGTMCARAYAVADDVQALRAAVADLPDGDIQDLAVRAGADTEGVWKLLYSARIQVESQL